MITIPDFIRVKFVNLLKSKRFNGCYLFCGVTPEIKFEVVKYFTQALNCLTPTEFLPCGVCANCQNIENNNYYGLVQINEEGESVKIEDILDLKKSVMKGSYQGFAVVYIHKAHLITISAANSLLKILEETPEGIIFVLDAANPYLLLSTIRSRSQVLNLGTVVTSIPEIELWPEITVDKFLNFIENNKIQDIIKCLEDSKIDKIESKTFLQAFCSWLFDAYLENRNSVNIKIIRIINKYIKIAERPVNITNNMLLLIMEVKETLKYA